MCADLTRLTLFQVLYLLRKMSRKAVYASPALRSVLVTSCETSVGLQLSDRLAAAGFRVFAGYKPDAVDSSPDGRQPSSSEACALLRLRVKQRESAATDVERAHGGGVVFIPLDVTREDSLHEAVVAVKRHLPAGEDGQYMLSLLHAHRPRNVTRDLWLFEISSVFTILLRKLIYIYTFLYLSLRLWGWKFPIL